MVKDLESIKEPEVSLEGKSWDDEDVRLLWAKNQLIYRSLADFWTPAMQTGKKLFDYLHGEIFDEAVRAEYEQVLGKIPIEPRVMKQKINFLAGELKKTIRSGKIITEGGMSVNEISTANLILKFFDSKIKEEFLLNEMLVNGITACLPQVIWFDHAKTVYRDQMAGLTADLLRWDSFVLEKYFKQAAGEDVRTICRIMRQGRAEMVDENPNREDAIKEHFERIGDDVFADLIEDTTGLTVEHSRALYYEVMTGLADTRLDGKQLVIERLSPVKTKAEIAIRMDKENDKTIDYQMRPGTWEDERWERWKRDNERDYVFLEDDVEILWQSRWTGEGLMLQNRPHWFQEHDDTGHIILPIVIFTPQIIDGKPTGPGHDYEHKILMKAIVETELLHDIRTGSGDLLVYRKGTIDNAEDLPHEMSAGNGIVVMDSEGPNAEKPISENIVIMKRTANKEYGEYSDRIDRDIDATDLLTPAVMGAHSPRQSNTAKQTEIAQALIGYSNISDNLNNSRLRLKNLECMLIPYVFTEQQVIEIQDDEDNDVQRVTVNEREFDLQGNGKVVANDLSSVRWRWRLVDGDDSPTQREAELNEMLIFWNTAAPVLIEADETLTMLSSVLKSMGNKTANKLGSVIEEKAKIKADQLSQQEMAKLMAELEEKRSKMESDKIKAMRAGFSFSVTAEDLQFHPEMFQMLVKHGYINSANNNQFQLPQPQGAVAA